MGYRLSDAEAHLYERVTNYVRDEFNRADALESEGRKGTVGFALTILQRRLASSPEAVYQSLRELIEERALARDSMDVSQVHRIREDMERAEARRLQPHFIASFFLEAFKLLGGTIRQREPKRYEITHVPAVIRNRDRAIGTRDAVLTRYERVTFEKGLLSVEGKPMAEFVCPGHPLLDATTDLVLERYRDLLKRGSILVDEDDPGEGVRCLVYLTHAIQDARTDRSGHRRIVSRQMQFVEVDAEGNVRAAGCAPYLDYRPLKEEEQSLVANLEEPD